MCNPLPVLHLFGEQPEMTESGPFQLEAERSQGDGPPLGQFAAIGPPPLFVFASLEAGVGLKPRIDIRPLERFRRAGTAGRA